MRRRQWWIAACGLLLGLSGCVDGLVGPPVYRRLHGRVLNMDEVNVYIGSASDSTWDDVIRVYRSNEVFRLVLRDTVFDYSISRGIDGRDLVVGDSVMAVITEGITLTSNPPIVPIRRVVVYRSR